MGEEVFELTRSDIVAIYKLWNEKDAAGECGGPPDPEASADFFLELAAQI